MTNEIRSAVKILAATGSVVEVRALADGVTHSGYFDDHEALARAVEALDADPAVAGIYVTLNTVNPALLARRANRIKMRLSRKDATTADAGSRSTSTRSGRAGSPRRRPSTRRHSPLRSGSRPTSQSRASLRPSGRTPGTGHTSSTGWTSRMTRRPPRS